MSNFRYIVSTFRVRILRVWDLPNVELWTCCIEVVHKSCSDTAAVLDITPIISMFVEISNVSMYRIDRRIWIYHIEHRTLYKSNRTRFVLHPPASTFFMPILDYLDSSATLYRNRSDCLRYTVSKSHRR